MVRVARDEMQRLARLLANTQLEAETVFREVWWFPDENDCELRLVAVNFDVEKVDRVNPYPFTPPAKTTAGHPVPTFIDIVLPGAVGVVALPDGWCAWKEAKKVAERKAK